MDALATFLEEAESLFEQLETTLLELDADPNTAGGVDAAFRALHTLKGSGSMMGFDTMSAFAHVLEAAFDKVRTGEIPMSRELAELGLQSMDVLKAHLEGGDETTQARETTLRQALAAIDRPTSCPPRPGPPGRDKYFVVRIEAEAEALRQGCDPLGVLERLQTLGEHRMEAFYPSLSLGPDFDETACHISWSLELWGDLSESQIMTALGPLPYGLQVEIQENGTRAHPEPASPTPDVAAAIMPPEDTPPAAGSKAAKRSTVKVDVEKLDQLLDLVGELVIARSRLAQLAEENHQPGLRSISEDVERLTQELRDKSMSLRMQPVGLLFKRYNRLVRDLGRQLNRDILLVTDGDETEIDKTVLERLGDCLVHLIRNAADHGIEPAAQREAAGKPSQGTLRLRASHEEGFVLLQVSDDGKGLNRDRIFARAVSKGLIGQDEQLPDEKVFDLIFEPGFSTAEQVSSVSGRGVGMDVVRRGIDELGGRVSIESVPGQGTTFTIRIPLTLAIVDGLLVHLGEESYVLPLDTIEECIEAPSRGEASSRHRVAEVRGELVPYLSLRDWFDIPGDPPALEQVVIANYLGSRFGFVVDKVVGQHQTVLKQMGPMTKVHGLSGSTILGDGTVALILDGASIMREAESTSN